MAMLFDPFRELDRVASSLLDSRQGPRFMPIDLHKDGDLYILNADLPGIDPGSVDVDVDGQLLTIRAERTARGTDVKWIVPAPTQPWRWNRHRAHQRKLRQRRTERHDPGEREGQAAQGCRAVRAH